MGSGKGGNSQPAATSSTVSQVQIPQELIPYYQDVMNRAQEASTQTYTPYTGQRIADFTQPQQQGFQMATNAATAYQPSLDTAKTQAGIAGQTTPGVDMQQYMNPFLSNVLNPQLAEARRQFNISQGSRDAAAARSNAFGGGRAFVENSNAQEALGRQLDQIQGQGLYSAYNQGLAQFNQDRTNAGQNATLQNALAGSSQQLGLQGASALGNVGAQQQAQQQQLLSQSYQDFLNQRDWNKQQIGWQSDIVHGLSSTPHDTVQTQTQAAPSTLSQLAGLGAGAYGLSKIMAKGGKVTLSKFAEGGRVKFFVGGGFIPPEVDYNQEGWDFGFLKPKGNPANEAFERNEKARKAKKAEEAKVATGSSAPILSNNLSTIANRQYSGSLPVTSEKPKSLKDRENKKTQTSAKESSTISNKEVTPSEQKPSLSSLDDFKVKDTSGDIKAPERPGEHRYSDREKGEIALGIAGRILQGTSPNALVNIGPGLTEGVSMMKGFRDEARKNYETDLSRWEKEQLAKAKTRENDVKMAEHGLKAAGAMGKTAESAANIDYIKKTGDLRATQMKELEEEIRLGGPQASIDLKKAQAANAGRNHTLEFWDRMSKDPSMVKAYSDAHSGGLDKQRLTLKNDYLKAIRDDVRANLDKKYGGMPPNQALYDAEYNQAVAAEIKRSGFMFFSPEEIAEMDKRPSGGSILAVSGIKR